jgi:hypothetical protein
MPNINVIKKSNFLKKEDVTPPVLAVIESVDQQNVAMEGAPQELRWCVHFKDVEKPMVLNSTNAQLIAKILGSDETDNWLGKKIVLFNDPSISFGGKLVGGIRVRAPKAAAKAMAAPTPAPAPEPEQESASDDVPF